MKYFYTCLFVCLSLFSCASQQTKSFSSPDAKKDSSYTEPVVIQNDVYIESQKVMKVEYPVFIVIDKNDKSVPKPIVDFYTMKDTMIYTYDNTAQYTIICKPLHNTDIVLEEGEIIVSDVIIGDSARWQVTSSFNMNETGVPTYHLFVKPRDFEISTTLTVNTNKRSYSFLLYSKKDGVFNVLVKFSYPVSYASPIVFFKQSDSTQSSTGSATSTSSTSSGQSSSTVKDVNYNYYMKYRNKKLTWIPKLVYDDGEKIYIVFDESIKYYTFPACYAGDKSVINYRVENNIIIIDNLYSSILLKLEKDEIYVYKK